MERFDQDLRQQPEWSSWPQQSGSHRWAIRSDDRLYPVKQIIAMATGQPTSGFSGGDEANGFAKKYGLEIVPITPEVDVSADLSRYISAFANLHSQVGAAYWPPETLHRAPHKPLLLLSVLDLIATGEIDTNRVELSPALRNRFRAYWTIVMPTDTRPAPSTTPFRYLASDGFWHLDNPADIAASSEPDDQFADSQVGQQPGIGTAHFDPELFELLQNADARNELSEVLINTYFAPEVRDRLRRLEKPAQASFWWVNQGSTYKLERDGSYLWAPKAGKSNVAFAHWTNVSRLQPGDTVLHYANNQLMAVSRVVQLPVAAGRPSELPADSWESDGYLARVSSYQELDPPIRRVDIPHEWRVAETSGPFTVDGNVKQGYLFPLTSHFVGELAERFPQVAALVDVPLPHRSTWLFQANPHYYDLSKELKTKTVGDNDSWSVTRYKDRIRPGDRALLWQGGTEAGIYAIGEITGVPFQRTELDDWIVKRDGPGAKPDIGVPYRLTHILERPLTKTVLQQHAVLKNMLVLRAPTGTNFAVTEEEWLAIQELIGEASPPGLSYVEPSFEDICADIAAKGLRFSERTLRRYHLSLKTHGFVILSGISGGGKTQLARAYAGAVGAESLVVPVAPNWNTNEDLLGYFNPVHEKYVDTPFSIFLRRAAQEYQRTTEAGRDS
jgi:hypothetical protein